MPPTSRAPAAPPGPAASWALHLLRRATWGPTPAALAELARLGSASAWLDRQLTPARVADPGGAAVDALYPELARSIPQVRSELEAFSWDLMYLTGQYQLARAVWSSRQLHEVMVAVWHDHLHVTVPSDAAWDSAHDYDRQVVRRHALGRFADLLAASATHPAMLTYLDNASSTAQAPNENYGRELLELHTVGVESGYTEEMVLDSARIMTGWTVGADGQAVYAPDLHATGPVRVLGFSHRNADPDGRPVVADLLRYLARHPATARRVATRLARRFVADDPPGGLVDRLAATYLSAGTAIAPVVRQLFTSPEFAAAGRKVRRPLEDLVATVRVLGHGLLPTGDLARRRAGVESLYWMAEGLREAPLAWGPPNGYPDVAAAWGSADVQLARWNAHQSLAAGWWPDATELRLAPPRTLLPARLPTRHGALVDLLARRLVGQDLTGPQRAAVLGFLGARSGTPLPPDSEWLDWRLPHLVALILDSPAHTLR